ncbi:hypothetical protein FKW77_006450 [Venturia effusa]|uniref:Cyanovirin-N domain-containing protein n=1 Tax=Venturia effusa TaxID=50376 RepID=A0A517LAZ0_9PEZI|nr:hypothetical protein FKW77_006450 [Venturia effusa]
MHLAAPLPFIFIFATQALAQRMCDIGLFKKSGPYKGVACIGLVLDPKLYDCSNGTTVRIDQGIITLTAGAADSSIMVGCGGNVKYRKDWKLWHCNSGMSHSWPWMACNEHIAFVQSVIE